ncbi:4Fe-4S binding protein [Nonomuraea angiospora]|uniref:NuoI/complex I 23 kDa subunit family protein n=1 Tax=Nonomuraea angiospora TaxID=46172 RepID=UPI0033F4CADB
MGRIPGVGLAKGLSITLRHMLRKSVTQQYPEVKPALPPRSRGVIALVEENCTSCMLCARECPDWCIYIDSHKETIPAPEGGRPRQRNVLDRFAIDFSLCMYCGICIEVCPFDALFWSPEFEYAEGDIRNLIHEKDKLAAWTQTVPPPPAHDPGAEPPKELTAAPRRPAARTARTAETPQRRGTAASPSPATPKPAAGTSETRPTPEARDAGPTTAKGPQPTTRAERRTGVPGTTSEAAVPGTTSEASVSGTTSAASVPETTPEAGVSGTTPEAGASGTMSGADASGTIPESGARGTAPDTSATTPTPDAQDGGPASGAPGSGPANAPSRMPGGRPRRPIQNVRGIRPPGALPSRAQDDTSEPNADAPRPALPPEEGQTTASRPAEDAAPTTEEADTADVAPTTSASSPTGATTSSPEEDGETGPLAKEPPQGQASSTGQSSSEKLSTASGVPQPKPEPEEQTSAASPRRRRMADPRSIRPPGRLGPDETRESEEES